MEKGVFLGSNVSWSLGLSLSYMWYELSYCMVSVDLRCILTRMCTHYSIHRPTHPWEMTWSSFFIYHRRKYFKFSKSMIGFFTAHKESMIVGAFRHHFWKPQVTHTLFITLSGNATYSRKCLNDHCLKIAYNVYYTNNLNHIYREAYNQDLASP